MRIVFYLFLKWFIWIFRFFESRTGRVGGEADICGVLYSGTADDAVCSDLVIKFSGNRQRLVLVQGLAVFKEGESSLPAQLYGEETLGGGDGSLLVWGDPYYYRRGRQKDRACIVMEEQPEGER